MLKTILPSLPRAVKKLAAVSRDVYAAGNSFSISSLGPWLSRQFSCSFGLIDLRQQETGMLGCCIAVFVAQTFGTVKV